MMVHFLTLSAGWWVAREDKITWVTVEFDVEDDRDPNGGEKDSNLRVWKDDQAAEGDDHISFPEPLLKVKSPSFGEKGFHTTTKPKPIHNVQ